MSEIRIPIDRVVTSVRLDRLVFARPVRSEGQSPDHIDRLVEAQWPVTPILVHRPTMRVIDGAHRVAAARIKGLTHIDACFFDGAEHEAFLLSVQENVTHGLPLSLPDRRAAAVRILAANPAWSDRSISSVTGLSDKTIAGIRRATAENPQSEHRIGRDGRHRPTNAAAARQLAAELILARPGASLRDIAQQVGISPSTVRDVRLRLNRGQSPVRPPRPVPSVGSDSGSGRAKAPSSNTPSDISTILTCLSRDPALRMSTAGRELIRWLHTHAISPDEVKRVFATTPPHCADHLVELAQRCATNWTLVAKVLADSPAAESTAVS